MLATLEVVASTEPGYRGIIRGAPQQLSDRFYRTEYPAWTVQAAQVLEPGEEEFTDFDGTLMCKLVAGPTTMLDQPCAPNGPFPWPSELVSDSLFASVYVDLTDPDASSDAAYVVNLLTQFLEPTVTVDPVGSGDANVTVRLHLEDNAELPRVIATPFSANGFTITCSLDGTAYAPCLDSGVATFAKTPLGHTLDVKTVASSDGATVIKRVTWDGGPAPLPPPPPPGVTPLTASVAVAPTTAKALKQTFTLAVNTQGFTVSCVADGKPVACFGDGTLQLLRVPGKHHLTTTVRAPDGQVVTHQLDWSVATPKTTFTVKAPATAERDAKIKVKASGLLPHGTYVIKLGADKVAKGVANDLGKVAKKVKVAKGVALGKVTVIVRGATKQRLGKDVVKVVASRVDPRLARILV